MIDISNLLKTNYNSGKSFIVTEPYLDNQNIDIDNINSKIKDEFTSLKNSESDLKEKIKKKWETETDIAIGTLTYYNINDYKLLKLEFLTQKGSSILEVKKIDDSLVLLIKLLKDDVVEINTIWCDMKECKEVCQILPKPKLLGGLFGISGSQDDGNEYLDWDPLF